MGCTNDLGLLSEEFDTTTGAMLGNSPQAFSQMAVIDTAVQLQQAAAGSAPLRTGLSYHRFTPAAAVAPLPPNSRHSIMRNN